MFLSLTTHNLLPKCVFWKMFTFHVLTSSRFFQEVTEHAYAQLFKHSVKDKNVFFGSDFIVMIFFLL